jgi:hypothetical protein
MHLLHCRHLRIHLTKSLLDNTLRRLPNHFLIDDWFAKETGAVAEVIQRRKQACVFPATFPGNWDGAAGGPRAAFPSFLKKVRCLRY